MKFLIIFSVIICGVAGATFIGLAQQKHPTELNQQAYLEGRAKAWGESSPATLMLSPVEPPAQSPIHQLTSPRSEWGKWGNLVVMAMFVLVMIPLSLFIYFLPSIIGKHKHNSGAIFVLNLFTGWSFIGWVIALVWACTSDPQTRDAQAPRLKEKLLRAHA